MLLVNAANLTYVKASSNDKIKLARLDRPSEYEAVKSPIKVKLDKDILMFIICHDDEEGKPHLYYNWLYSTTDKFKEDYLKQRLHDALIEVDNDRQLWRFHYDD